MYACSEAKELLMKIATCLPYDKFCILKIHVTQLRLLTSTFSPIFAVYSRATWKMRMSKEATD